MRSLHIGLGILLGSISTAVLVSAWTGPTGVPPTNNTAAPINVSSASQVKNGNLSVNGLSVTGTAVIAGGWASTPTTTSYLNFSNTPYPTLPTTGSSGYGIRDNNGTLEFKNLNGRWYRIVAIPICATDKSTLEWRESTASWACVEPEQPPPRASGTSCQAILNAGYSTGSGIYNIDPDGSGSGAAFDAYCDMETDGGGWTLLALAGTGNNWDYDSTNWTGGTEVGTLPTNPMTQITDYRSPAYGNLPSREYLVKTFDQFAGTGRPSTSKWVFGSAYTAIGLIGGSTAVTPSSMTIVEGSQAAYPYTVKTFGSRNCHNYASGIMSRICTYKTIDFNSANYPHYGDRRAATGSKGDVFYINDSRWYFRDADGNIALSANCGNSTCPTFQFSIWARNHI